MTLLINMELVHESAIPLIFLLLTSITSPIFGQVPVISFISKEKVVDIGDRTELLCSVEHARQYPVHWVKISSSGPTFLSRGKNLIQLNSRFGINYKDNTYKLIISKVQEVDAGDYECQIVSSASFDLISGRTKLIVRIPPVITDNSTRSVITSVASTVQLHCYANGNPKPKIFWRRKGNELLPNGRGAFYKGNMLILKNLTKDDRGTYYCVADNGVIPGARRAMGVEVEFPPIIKIGRPRYGQALQYDALLSCDIEAFPSPAISWMKDGEKLTDNIHYEVSIFSKSDEFSSSTLRVKRIEKKQYGDYYCMAMNKLGSESKKIILEETINVICPPACENLDRTSGAPNNFIQFWLAGFTITLIIFILF